MSLLMKVGVVVGILMLAIAYITLAERRILAFMQFRMGPNRVGWGGVLQPLADAVKLLSKECIMPEQADKWMYRTAPVVSMAFALVPFAVVPFAQAFYITDINIGLLFIMAMGSVGFLGTIMGGWSSRSKYSFLGSLRALALMISFEVPMIMAMTGVIIFSRSLSMVKIVEAQAQYGWFVLLQPLAFVIYLLCGVAETQRIPFDMLEDEGSLVCGFHTEYSGIRFGLFFMAEYANMFMVAIVATVLFLGGWQRPFVSWPFFNFLSVIPSIFWFSIKVLALMFLYIWLRGTLPRVRYDQLIYLCWKILLPLSLINLMLTALYMLWGMNAWTFLALSIGSGLAWLWVYDKTQTLARSPS